jgi:transposase
VGIRAANTTTELPYFAGLDVGLHKTALCIADGDGKVWLERRLASEIGDVVAGLRAFRTKIGSVGLKAGTLAQWLAYGLRAASFRPVVVEARQINTTLSAMRNKTDRNDARGIAQFLRTGWYRPVHVKSIQSHYTRTILAASASTWRTKFAACSRSSG